MTGRAAPAGALPAVLVASGAAGLVFEVLWFRQAALAFGSGVWASSLVLSSFMAGLALGNALAARRAGGWRRPLRAYAAAEVVVGLLGPALVWLLPRLPTLLRPLLVALDPHPLALNAFRSAAAFLLLVLPATAMGLTFPVVVRAAETPGSPFARLLGRLYGWNTLGAVAGAAATELVLVPRLGVAGTSLAAAALDALAAGLAWRLARAAGTLPEAPLTARAAGRLKPGPLVAAFLSGGLLLALEVVWFRTLLLFVAGSSLAFALLLAVVLAGIAAGGFLAGRLARSGASRLDAPVSLLLAGAATAATYAALPAAARPFDLANPGGPGVALALGAALMLPTSLLSGLSFALLGQALARTGQDAARTAGALTLANTAGALAGAPLAALVLLPQLGTEASTFLVALLYGLAAAAAAWDGSGRGPGAAIRLAAAALLALCAVTFPWGQFDTALVARVVARFGGPATVRPALVREGTTETVVLLEHSLLGETSFHRLVTNGFTMSGTRETWSRYMRLFVYLPAALHPQPRSALLICFGVGSTAHALAETPSLRRIDIVDISREVLETGRLLYPPPDTNPLDDPRVKTRVEDGRYVLASGTARWDLITAEPPPPQVAGVSNLYSREYFALVRSRLAPGGIATHWLPVHGLPRRDALSIVRSFCDVFSDCSLWNGWGNDWILMGTEGATWRPALERTLAPWRDPRQAAVRRELALERPEQLYATFLGDASFLRTLTASVPPLVDDFPRRLSERMPDDADRAFYRELSDSRAARGRFARSAAARALVPPELLGPAEAAFAPQDVLNHAASGSARIGARQRLEDLHAVLTRSRLETLVTWIEGTTPREVAIAERARLRGPLPPEGEVLLAVGALARRDYAAAARLLDGLDRLPGAPPDVAGLNVLALALAGRGDEARAALDAGLAAGRLRGGEAFAAWARRTLPLGPAPAP